MALGLGTKAVLESERRRSTEVVGLYRSGRVVLVGRRLARVEEAGVSRFDSRRIYEVRDLVRSGVWERANQRLSQSCFNCDVEEGPDG